MQAGVRMAEQRERRLAGIERELAGIRPLALAKLRNAA